MRTGQIGGDFIYVSIGLKNNDGYICSESMQGVGAFIYVTCQYKTCVNVLMI